MFRSILVLIFLTFSASVYAHDITPPKVSQSVAALANALSFSGSNLEGVPGQKGNVEGLFTLFLKSSDSLLSSAKTLGPGGGDAGMYVGLVASSFEGISTSYQINSRSMRAVHLRQAATSLLQLGKGLGKHAKSISGGDDFLQIKTSATQAAFALTSAAATLKAASKMLAAGETDAANSAIGRAGGDLQRSATALFTYAELIPAFSAFFWTDECKCKAGRWDGRGVRGPNGRWNKWIWQKCVVDVGILCDTCVWRDIVQRDHPWPGQKEPKKPQPKDPHKGDEEL